MGMCCICGANGHLVAYIGCRGTEFSKILSKKIRIFLHDFLYKKSVAICAEGQTVPGTPVGLPSSVVVFRSTQ